MMAEAQEDDDEVFVYMGGSQVMPNRFRRAKIHKHVKIVRARAFEDCRRLIFVEFHDGIEIIERDAFNGCTLLRGPIKLLGIRIIGIGAFSGCESLTDVEFGDKLQAIESLTFHECTSLRSITIPRNIRTIGRAAFCDCHQLNDMDLPEGLETLGGGAFQKCYRLRRITMPLKDGLIEDGTFNYCPDLTTVQLVGGIHRTVASLHLESWRNEMKGEINRINQVLPTTSFWSGKTLAVQQWMESVSQRVNHYKTEHRNFLREATTLLELALWKANLDDNEGGVVEREGVPTTRRQLKRARKEICVTSGTDIVIKNVLPFLCLP